MDKPTPPEMRCEQCGEQLDTVHAYIRHLAKHEQPKKAKPEPEREPLTILKVYEGFKKFAERMLLYLLLFLGLLMFWVLLNEFRKSDPIVNPFDVPPEFTKEFTGVTIAELLIDEINDQISSPPQMQVGIVKAGSGGQAAKGEPVRLKRASSEGLTIKMEVGGISLDSFVAYVKSNFGLEREQISGNVIKTANGMKIFARTTKQGRGPWSEEGGENELQRIIKDLAAKMTFDLASDNLASHYLNPTRLADFYFNKGLYFKADKAYDEITRKNPDDAEAYTNWAKVLIKMNETDEAVCKYREAVRVSCPKDVRQKILEENEPGKEDTCPQAKRRSILTALLNFRSESRHISCADAIIEWGVGLSVMNNGEGAIEKYKQAEEVDPQNARIYSEWGYELDLQGKENEADALFAANFPKCDKYRNDASLSYKAGDKIAEMNISCSDFYNNWGLVLDQFKKYDGSIDKYQKAAQLTPGYYLAYYNWGLALYNLGREFDDKFNKSADKSKDRYLYDIATKKFQESINKYKHALDLNPKYIDAYNNLGLNYHALGDYEEAIKQYKKVVDVDPRSYRTFYNWGLALDKLCERYKESEKCREAIEKYRKATQIKADYHIAYDALGYGLQKQGNYPEAIERYKQALSFDPNYLLSLEGWVMSLTGELGKEKNPSEVKRIKRELAEANNKWGYALELAERKEDALQRYGDAIESDPGYEIPYFNLGYVLFSQGKKEEAYGNFEKFLKLSDNKNPGLEQQARNFLSSKASNQLEPRSPQ